MIEKNKHSGEKLGQWLATAICGNDILSSALYVSGIAIIFAGVFAPVVLLLVALVLFFYKKVYTEVVEALPINGGAYNCLLNGTSKQTAAIAGVMTILSYIATAVISAKIGVEYLATIVNIPVIPVTIGLLFAFALLVISGMKDSARVALIIFCLHIITLFGFLIFGLWYFFNGESHFIFNLQHTKELITQQSGLIPMLYLAFSASLLGVSGFESSANFVEEQKPGVFRKTLRNMLLGVAFFNPLIALVVLNSMRFEAVASSKDFLLANAAHILGGPIFQYIVVFDALLVLSGAVMTAYVGVSGLMDRMVLDECLPGFLAKHNSRGAHPRIVLVFFLLCSSILIITHGKLLSLAGVYTISFLGVMSSFALGNLILKRNRPDLKRTYRAPMFFVIIAFIATVMGMFGNIRIDQQNFVYFEFYFVPALIIILLILYRDYITKWAMNATKKIPFIYSHLEKRFDSIIEGKIVVLIHHIGRAYDILEYIKKNETSWNIVLVCCRSDDSEDAKKNYRELVEAVPILKKAGVFPHFRVKLAYIDKSFGPEVIDQAAKKFNVKKNRIFIGSIHHYHPFEYSDLGGVRIIS